MPNWSDYWASLTANQDEAEQGGQPQTARAPVSLSGAGSAYQTDPTGVGPPQGDVTREDFGQPIVTHYNPMYHATDATAQNLASQYSGQVISAPEREAGGGTPGSPWTMPDANYIRTADGAIANAGQLQKYIDAFGPVVGARMIKEELAGDTPEALARQGVSGADYWYNQYRNNPAIQPPSATPSAPPAPAPVSSGREQGNVTGRGGVAGPRGAGGGSNPLPSEDGMSSTGTMPGRIAGGRTVSGLPPSLGGAGGNPASGTQGGRQMPPSLSGGPTSEGGGTIPPGRTTPPGRPPSVGNPATPSPTGGRTVTPPVGPKPPAPPPPPGTPSQPSFPGTTRTTTPSPAIPAGPNSLFPNWNQGDPGDAKSAAYAGSDPGYMATALQARSLDYGNRFESDYSGAYNNAQGQAQQYQDQSDNAYNWLNQNPGYNADESAGITQEGRLNGAMTTQGEFDSNQLSDGERQGMMGDAASVGRAFDPSKITSTSKEGTDWTRGTYEDSNRAAHDALNKGEAAANSTLSDYGTRLRATVDPSKLGISDEAVAGYKDQAGRQIGLQYGAAQDQMQRQAEAAGNVNPLSLAGARERLLRSSAIDQADAVTNADLSAHEAQRQANVGMAGMRQSNENAIGNAGLNTNLSLAGLRTGTEAAYGTLGANVGATSNAQNTAAVTAAGNTAIQQAGYQDTANAARSGAIATNRQATNQGNQAAKYQQGYNTATSLSGANKAIGDLRIQGQQAARNYWQGQGQFQGAQANAATSGRIAGAQTSLSGQGQGAQVGMGTEIGRRGTRPVTFGTNGIQVGI